MSNERTQELHNFITPIQSEYLTRYCQRQHNEQEQDSDLVSPAAVVVNATGHVDCVCTIGCQPASVSVFYKLILILFICGLKKDK